MGCREICSIHVASHHHLETDDREAHLPAQTIHAPERKRVLPTHETSISQQLASNERGRSVSTHTNTTPHANAPSTREKIKITFMKSIQETFVVISVMSLTIQTAHSRSRHLIAKTRMSPSKPDQLAWIFPSNCHMPSISNKPCKAPLPAGVLRQVKQLQKDTSKPASQRRTEETQPPKTNKNIKEREQCMKKRSILKIEQNILSESPKTITEIISIFG